MMKDHAAMNDRGDKGMGFSQEKTTHHFRLSPDGGTIEVSANDAKIRPAGTKFACTWDTSRKCSSTGNFQLPMFVHDKMLDGAAVMKKDKAKNRYTYGEMANGVRIRASSPEILKAVQEFPRFQITEDQTGDPMEIGTKS